MSYIEFQSDNHKEMGLIAVVESLSATVVIGDNIVTLRQTTHSDIYADTRAPYQGLSPLVNVSSRVLAKTGKRILDIVSLRDKPKVFMVTKSGALQPTLTHIYSDLIAEILAYYHSEQCRLDFATHETNECTVKIAELESEIALLQWQKAKYEAIAKDVKER